MFGFENNREDITGKILIDGYDREFKDVSKEGRYAGKQLFLSGTRLKEGTGEPVSHLN